MPSKLVTDRQKSSQAVIAAADTHAATVTTTLSKLFTPVAPKKSELPDVATMMLLAARVLQRSEDTMLAADEAHERELSDDAGPRTTRDQLAQGLQDSLVELREVATGLLGRSAVATLGLVGNTPRDPAVLVRTARLIAENLESAELPASRVRGAKFDAKGWIERLSTGADALAKALSKVAKEDREAEATQVAKDRAIDAFDGTFGDVATFVSAALRLGGEKELAARVRPSARRPGRTAGEDEETPTPTPSAGGGTPPAAV